MGLVSVLGKGQDYIPRHPSHFFFFLPHNKILTGVRLKQDSRCVACWLAILDPNTGFFSGNVNSPNAISND